MNYLSNEHVQVESIQDDFEDGISIQEVNKDLSSNVLDGNIFYHDDLFPF